VTRTFANVFVTLAIASGGLVHHFFHAAMRILALWPVIAASLLASMAHAQTVGEACETFGLRPVDYYQDYILDAWPKEAQRIKGNERRVSRQGDRLRLVVDGGKTVELLDCPYADVAYAYLYDRYDEAGRFHVVRKPSHEDLSYILVMTGTGRLFTVYSPPVWTPAKSKFLTIACSMLPPRGMLTIHAPTGEGVTTEAEFELPCDPLSCSARWDSESRISVGCVLQGSSLEPVKGREFVLARGDNGTWSKSER
jgi:hypothetical protein